MKITETQRFALKKFVKELEQFRRTHTELITVYVPQGYDMNKIIQHLAQEQGTASNIKSASTKKNVIAGLEKMIQHLRLFKKTPEHGLAVFSGNVADREGMQDLRVWSLEPPLPLNTRIYRCDKNFQLDLLFEMLDDKQIYGLVLVDRRDANVALLKGKTIIPVLKTHSQVPGKFRAGGQCIERDSLVQLSDGSLPRIDIVHNPHRVKSVMIKNNFSIRNSNVTDKWKTRRSAVYTIITKNPRLEIRSSKDHTFFVATSDGLVEKAAEALQEGDYLVMPEKIEVPGAVQRINPKKYYNCFSITKKGKALLKRRRLQKGFSQEQLAKKLNTFQATVSSFEAKEVNFSPSRIESICRALELDFETFLEKHTQTVLYRHVRLPQIIDEQFAHFLGYLVGDGCIETDRITFFEQDKQLAFALKEKFDEFFKLQSSYRFRESKNYHQLRFTSRPLVRLIRDQFVEIRKTRTAEIPEKILTSKNEVLAAFLRGLFDAEGYVNNWRGVGLGINNKKLSRQIQLALLRFSIMASLHEYDNRKNKYSDHPRFTVDITEKQSLELFRNYIGFTASRKEKKLNALIKRKSNTSYMRQMVVPGTTIRRVLENAGYTVSHFPKVNNFFRNERMMSKNVFVQSILGHIKDKSLYRKLKAFHDYPLLPVKIKEITVAKKSTDMVDISVKSQNFLANGVLVHNSAARFSRLREGAIKDHYKKVAEHIKDQFLGKKELKGIIVGGPGPSKHDFVDGNFLTQEIKNKIIGVKDLSYTGEFGLQELLEKSEDLLAEEDVIEEKKIMQRFFDRLNKDPGSVAYGEKEVAEKLAMGAVETILVSESIDEKKIEHLEEEAQNVGSEVKIISVETREGTQLKEMSGVAALLRYSV